MAISQAVAIDSQNLPDRISSVSMLATKCRTNFAHFKMLFWYQQNNIPYIYIPAKPENPWNINISKKYYDFGGAARILAIEKSVARIRKQYVFMILCCSIWLSDQDVALCFLHCYQVLLACFTGGYDINGCHLKELRSEFTWTLKIKSIVEGLI